MFKLEVHWIAGMVCMHGQKPLNGALGCKNVGLKVCIPSIAGLECSLGVQKFPGDIGYVVLQISKFALGRSSSEMGRYG